MESTLIVATSKNRIVKIPMFPYCKKFIWTFPKEKTNNHNLLYFSDKIRHSIIHSMSGSCEHGNELSGTISAGKFLSNCINGGLLIEAQQQGVSCFVIK